MVPQKQLAPPRRPCRSHWLRLRRLLMALHGEQAAEGLRAITALQSGTPECGSLLEEILVLLQVFRSRNMLLIRASNIWPRISITSRHQSMQFNRYAYIYGGPSQLGLAWTHRGQPRAESAHLLGRLATRLAAHSHLRLQAAAARDL